VSQRTPDAAGGPAVSSEASRRSHRTPTWWTTRLSLAAVILIAGVASYLHSLVVVQVADGQTFVAHCIPALADLVIASASANLLDASRRDERLPRLSVLAAGVGVLVTLAANVASGDPAAVPVWCVNVWPPVAFLLALESLVGHVRRGRDGGGEGAVPAAPAGDEPGPVDVADTLQRLVDHFGSQRAAAEALGMSRDVLRARIRKTPPLAEVAAMNGDGHG
jgi:hypothetical protein